MDRKTKILLALSIVYLVFLMGMVVWSIYTFLEEPPEPEPNDGHMSPLGHLHVGSPDALFSARRFNDAVHIHS